MPISARTVTIFAGVWIRVGQGFNLVDVRSPAEFVGDIIAPPGMTRKPHNVPVTSPARRMFRGPPLLRKTAHSSL